MGNIDFDSIIIGLINSIRDVELMKYNERLSQVHSNIIDDMYNFQYNEIKITIEENSKSSPLLTLIKILL